MPINLTRIIAAVVFFMIWGVAVSPVMAQQTSATSQTPRVIKFDGDMAAMLVHLTEIFGVTIGLEVDPKRPKSRVSFYLRDPTLNDVLNAIVKSDPTYQWRERGGCIEVLPLEASNPLLDVIIGNFRVSEVDQTGAINRLLNLPDVQAAVRAMSLNLQDAANASTETKKEKFSLNLGSVTIRQALSMIANESGGRFWVFRASGDGLFSIRNSLR